MSGYNGLDHLYEKLDVSEVIPESMRMPQIKAASVVKGRRNAKYVPIGPGQYTFTTSPSATSKSNSTNIMSFRVTDSQSFIDLQSCYLNFNVQITEAFGSTVALGRQADQALGSSYTVPENDWTVAFQRARCSVNGVVLEDLNEVNALTQALLLCDGNQNVVNKHLGVLAGSWKHNGDLSSVNGTDSAAVSARRVAIGKMYRGSAGGANANGIQAGAVIPMSIPLSLLFDLHRVPQYFSLRNAGSLQYDFYFDDVRNFMLGALTQTAGTYADVAVDFTQCSITGDLIDLDPAFTSAYDRLCASMEPGDGIKIPINTWLTMTQQYQTSNDLSQKGVAFSKSTPQLRQILMWKRNPAAQNNLGHYYVSSYDRLDQGNPLAPGYTQWRIGSDLFPQNGMITAAEHYRELTKSMGGFHMNATSLLTLPMYTNMYGADISTNEVGCPNSFIWGFSFDKVQGLHESIHMDGYDASIQSLIACNFCDGGKVARTENLTAAICYTRYLCISGNQVEVKGF